MFHLQPNTLLADRYLIQEEIGKGGMGVVYSALDQAFGDKPCALKVLREPHSSEKSKRRFEEEIRCARKLNSPHIVKVFETGTMELQYGARQYVVMELIEGIPLSDLLKSEPLGAERAAHIALGVTSALQVAHREGVVHRDLKPANIIVGDLAHGGVVKILDFGIAKDLSREETLNLTRTGMLVGTPTYMSPERFQIDVQLTPAADLYSVGLLLYNMITGRPPVYVKHPALPPEILRLPAPLQVCWLHVNYVPPTLTSCPPSLAKLTDELLSKEPQDRPSAEEARTRLSELLYEEYNEPEDALTESLPQDLFNEVLAQYTPLPFSAPDSPLDQADETSGDLELDELPETAPNMLSHELRGSLLEPLEEPAPPSPKPQGPPAPIKPPQLEAAPFDEPEDLNLNLGADGKANAVKTLMLNPDDMIALNEELSRLVEGGIPEEPMANEEPVDKADELPSEGHTVTDSYPPHLHSRSTLRLDSDDKLLDEVKQHSASAASEPIPPPLLLSDASSPALGRPTRRVSPLEAQATVVSDERPQRRGAQVWLIPTLSLIIGGLITYLTLMFFFK